MRSAVSAAWPPSRSSSSSSSSQPRPAPRSPSGAAAASIAAMSETSLKAPGGIIYEPGERVLAVGRPFAWWTFLLAFDLVLMIAAARGRGAARGGPPNRPPAGGPPGRVREPGLPRPFPASLFADYGILKLETAGMHSEERVTEGLHEIAITGASRFYAQLTDALTPGR